MPTFNELVIKNDPVKKAASFFAFMEGVQLSHNQVLVLEYRTFHCKVFNRVYPKSTFNILQTLTLLCQLHKILGWVEVW